MDTLQQLDFDFKIYTLVSTILPLANSITQQCCMAISLYNTPDSEIDALNAKHKHVKALLNEIQNLNSITDTQFEMYMLQIKDIFARNLN